MKWAALAALALLTPVTCGAGEFRSIDVEALRITIDTDWAPRTAPGYLPARFEITNLGDARVIDIVAEGTRFWRWLRVSPPRSYVRQSLRMARGDRVRLTMPIPIFAESENFSFEIQENGRTLEGFGSSSLASGASASDASVLVVADRGSPLGAVATGLLRPVPSGGIPITALSAVPARPTLDFQLQPGRLPVSWLGYTSLRAVVIGSEEWATLDDAQKGALLTWTACGGDLILATADRTPLAGGGHRTPDAPEGGAPRAYFLGRIHRREAASIAREGLSAVIAAAHAAQDAEWGLPANRSPSWKVINRGFRLAIPGVSGLPTRAYLSILILFAVLIGPVNYWFLWRRRRQVLFMLTAPVISVLFIVLLAGYVVAGEGFHVNGRAATFTLLDQARRQAVTRGSASLYAAGMTPSGGLRFPRDVAVYALGTDGTGSRISQTLDLTETQQFSSGVIQARAPTNLEVIGFRPARERLTFERDASGVRVVNGLGATVRRLVLRSGGQMYSLDGPLADGASGALKAGAIDAIGFVPGGLPLQARFLTLFQAQPEASYLAVLDRSPFWDPGVPRVVERDSFHLLLGWLDGQP